MYPDHPRLLVGAQCWNRHDSWSTSVAHGPSRPFAQWKVLWYSFMKSHEIKSLDRIVFGSMISRHFCFCKPYQAPSIALFEPTSLRLRHHTSTNFTGRSRFPRAQNRSSPSANGIWRTSQVTNFPNLPNLPNFPNFPNQSDLRIITFYERIVFQSPTHDRVYVDLRDGETLLL